MKRHFCLRVREDPFPLLSAVAKLACWRGGPTFPLPPSKDCLGKLPPLLPEHMGGTSYASGYIFKIVLRERGREAHLTGRAGSSASLAASSLKAGQAAEPHTLSPCHLRGAHIRGHCTGPTESFHKNLSFPLISPFPQGPPPHSRKSLLLTQFLHPGPGPPVTQPVISWEPAVLSGWLCKENGWWGQCHLASLTCGYRLYLALPGALPWPYSMRQRDPGP